ncbi:DUF4369 domain-containing protein [Sphingobacterium faecale]|uniref:DUF4369 domain-containing protein n=1 Tax=Sphingobacterium faecale TaxID=2803775 RepID=A0ABS1R033_9SPHI|nr:DUF4369 domain-containing protein [Sphingobacterium faecale]MBL1408051.1 hypothetical protein [Sphingobacterium faecale]
MKTLYLLIFTLTSFPSFSQYKYTIEGKFNTDLFGDTDNYSIRDGDLIYLKFLSSPKTDTARVKNKSFRFEGESSKPEITMLSVSLQHLGKGPAFGNLLLLDNCHYDISYKQTSDKFKRVFYDDKISTNSKFYHLWETIGIKKEDYLSKENELKELLESPINTQNKSLFEKELTEVRKALDELYKNAAQEYSGTYEMTYLLPTDPNFNYERYIAFYNELPEYIRKSYYGEKFYQRLILTKPEHN